VRQIAQICARNRGALAGQLAAQIGGSGASSFKIAGHVS
jgi:hypothetical protein